MRSKVRAILFVAIMTAACAHDPFPQETTRRPIELPRGSGLSCSRAAPTAVLDSKHPNVLSLQFRRTSPSEAEETARLKGNILLTIFHTGCTRSATRYRFQLFGPAARPFADRAYWYTRASELIRVLGGDGRKRIAESLQAAAKSRPPYGERLPMGDYDRLDLTLRESPRGPVVIVSFSFAL